MAFSAVKTELKEILKLRALYLAEMNRQIRYNACHQRGWTDSYLLVIDDLIAGYGSIKGREIEARDTVFEFFPIRPWRNQASRLFRALVAASGARFIECQSNDPFMSSMLFEFCSTAAPTWCCLRITP